jgi:hypothetical protein
MASKDDQAEIVRMSAMTDEDWRAHIAAPGRDRDTAELKSFCEDSPIEDPERALFAAILDGIMNFADLGDLDIRVGGTVRSLQEPNAGHEPARLRRAGPLQARDTLFPHRPADKARPGSGPKRRQ